MDTCSIQKSSGRMFQEKTYTNDKRHMLCVASADKMPINVTNDGVNHQLSWLTTEQQSKLSTISPG